MSSEQSRPDSDQIDAAYESTGDKQKVTDLFKRVLELPTAVKYTNVIILEEPSPFQISFLKHLVQLLKEKHEIKYIYVQCNTEPDSTTMQSEGLDVVYYTDNIGGTRPAIYHKIDTSSVVFAPSVPLDKLSQVFGTSGLGLLICKDINDIVAENARPGEVFRQGDWIEPFGLWELGGYKMKMPLLEGGRSWCEGTSIHRLRLVGVTCNFEETNGIQRGWIAMGVGRPKTRVYS